jgi:hypothetical protein
MRTKERSVSERWPARHVGLWGHARAASLLTASIAFCLLVVADPARARAATQQELLDSLQKKWESQRSEIYTASIRFRKCQATGELKALKFEEVAALVASTNVLKDRDALRELISQMTGKPLAQTPKWIEVKFEVSGHNLREEINGAIQIATEDSKLELDNTNKAVQLFTPGRSQRHQTTLSDLRFIPLAKSKISLRSVKDRKAVLDAGRTEYHVDIETGAVEEAIRRGADGNVVDCRWQGGFALSAAGINFPTWRIRARFNSQAELWYLGLTVIDHAVFNEPIPNQDFHAQAPAGIAVLDNRIPGQETSFRLNRNVADVAAAVADPSAHATFPGEPTPSGRFRYTSLVVLNAGILLVFLGYSFIRYRAKQHGAGRTQ